MISWSETLIFMRSAEIKEALYADCFGFFIFIAQKSFERETILNDIFSDFVIDFAEYDIAGGT